MNVIFILNLDIAFRQFQPVKRNKKVCPNHLNAPAFLLIFRHLEVLIAAAVFYSKHIMTCGVYMWHNSVKNYRMNYSNILTFSTLMSTTVDYNIVFSCFRFTFRFSKLN